MARGDVVVNRTYYSWVPSYDGGFEFSRMNEDYRKRFLHDHVGEPISDNVGGYRIKNSITDAEEETAALLDNRIADKELRLFLPPNSNDHPSMVHLDIIVLTNSDVTESIHITIDTTGFLKAQCDNDTEPVQTQGYSMKSVIKSIRNLFLEADPGVDFDRTRDSIPVIPSGSEEEAVNLIADGMMRGINNRTAGLKKSCKDVNSVLELFEKNSSTILEKYADLGMSRVDAIVRNHSEICHERWSNAEQIHQEWYDAISMVHAFLNSTGRGIEGYPERLEALEKLGQSYYEDAYRAHSAEDDGLRFLRQIVRRAENDKKISLLERIAVSITFLVGFFTILAATMSVIAYLTDDSEFWYRLIYTIFGIVISFVLSWIIAGRASTRLMGWLEKKWNRR